MRYGIALPLPGVARKGGNMAEAEIDNPEKSLVSRLVPRRKRWRVTLAVVLFLLGGMIYIWTQRERIADDVVADQLSKFDIPASYKIESIGPDAEVLTDIVIGDPARPDLTIKRAVVRLRYGFGAPQIRSVTLEQPRLFGSYRGGKLSFGALDPLVFAESDDPPGLPDLDLELLDGRALIETDFGPVWIKAECKGWLPGEFSGVVAASAPALAVSGCRIDGATLFGQLTTATGQATLEGPVRLAAAQCRDRGFALGQSSADMKVTASPTFDRFDGNTRLALGKLAASDAALSTLAGTAEFAWTGQGVDMRYDLAGRGASLAEARLGTLELDGALRARGGFERVTTDGSFSGRKLSPGPALDRSLAGLVDSASGTLAAPLLQQIRSALGRELPGSSVAGDFDVRSDGDGTSVTIPAAGLRGASGTALLSLSRVQVRMGEGGLPRFSGNVVTGGAGLPRISGRMERLGDRRATFRLSMAEYSAGSSTLAIPAMVLAQAGDGSLGFSGEVLASGALPGGSVQGLRLPLSGSWASSGQVSVWPRCTTARFDRLVLANLELGRQSLNVCPGPAGAIVRGDGQTWRVAAGTPSLALSGRLSGSRLRVTTGPVGFAIPGTIAAKSVSVELGEPGALNRFTLAEVIGQSSASGIAGTFAGADVDLYAVPLDIREAAGAWRYAGGELALTDAQFRLLDRSEPDRFTPLVARGATLSLVDGRITAAADLRNPASDRVVTNAAIVHDLGSATGYADLAVAGLVFDKDLQPDMLSELALGVVANVRGTVTGTGRIDWNSGGVTSSGAFSTDNLDLAAAFGPVRGARGTVRFVDLLNLTTAPGQRLTVDSVNPGIEALGGEIEFDLRDGRTLAVTGGTWPFMGGELTLEPVTMNFGVGEERRYVFRVVGLEAQRFVQQMELGNLNANGVFDGVLPIVFDEMGNGRIEGGVLDSRPPGGNVSYIGELTYEDMGAIANFAFAALRSLDYKVMNIRMDGPLTGEIVTRVRFDGVSQGEGTKRNFITRQIADLPIRFNVNIRAPFYQLITSVRAMYDPAFIRDPRELGLLSSEGSQLKPATRPELEAIKPEDMIPDEVPIQKLESESMP